MLFFEARKTTLTHIEPHKPRFQVAAKSVGNEKQIGSSLAIFFSETLKRVTILMRSVLIRIVARLSARLSLLLCLLRLLITKSNPAKVQTPTDKRTSRRMIDKKQQKNFSLEGECLNLKSDCCSLQMRLIQLVSQISESRER